MYAASLGLERYTDGDTLSRRECHWQGKIRLKITVTNGCSGNHYVGPRVVTQGICKDFAIPNRQCAEIETRVFQRQDTVLMTPRPIVMASQLVVAQTLTARHRDQASQNTHP